MHIYIYISIYLERPTGRLPPTPRKQHQQQQRIQLATAADKQTNNQNSSININNKATISNPTHQQQ